MTDSAVIGIIATTLVMGLTIIGVQITMFIYLLRRTDTISERIHTMQKEFAREFSAVRQEISAVRQETNAVVERVARLEGILIGRQEVGNGTLPQTGDD